MSDNPLVAEPEPTSALSGTFLAYDGWNLCNDLAHGSWTAALDAVAVTLDVAATASDPLGSLIAAGLGWLMDHLEPLKGWLDDLAGDPGVVKGYAETWHNIAESLRRDAETLESAVASDLGAMTGDAVEAYRTFAEGLAKQARGAGEAADGTGTALTIMGTVVDAVHGTVRDVLAQVVGALISYAAEAVFTLGLATPLVVEQATTRVAEAADEVGGRVRTVVEARDGLKAAVHQADGVLDHVRGLLDKLQPGVAKGAHRADPGAPRHVPGEEPTVRTPDGDTTPADTTPGDTTPADTTPGDGKPGDDTTPGAQTTVEPPARHVKTPDEILLDRLGDIGKRDDWQDALAETAAAGASTGRPKAE